MDSVWERSLSGVNCPVTAAYAPNSDTRGEAAAELITTNRSINESNIFKVTVIVCRTPCSVRL